jgi:hypothetical protein
MEKNTRGTKKTRIRDIFKILKKRVKINEIAKQTQIDIHSKELKLIEDIKIMIWGTIENIEKLRELSTGLKGTNAKKEGLIEISTSQLSKVHRSRDYRVFVWVFTDLQKSIKKHHKLWRYKSELKLLGLDSSFVKMKTSFSKIGFCSSSKGTEEGIKLHTSALLGTMTLPLSVIVTPGNEHDSINFKDLLYDSQVFIDLQDVILVFDKGYWKLKRFKIITKNGIKFVTLMKKGIVYEDISEKRAKNVIDKNIEFSNGLKLRLVQICKKDGKDEYLTNIFNLSALEIQEIYSRRWEIEIFFREIKSYLKINHFMGRNLNSVLIQIYSVLITYTLMILFKIIYDLMWISIIDIKRYLRYESNLDRISQQILYVSSKGVI